MLASTELNTRAAGTAKPTLVATLALASAATGKVVMPMWMYRLLGVRPTPSLPQSPLEMSNSRLKVSGLSAGSTFRCYPR